MKYPSSLHRLLVAGLLLLTLPLAAADNWPIISRRGDALYEGDKPFRFFGLAAPNIQAHESQIWADFGNRFPDDYETRDMLDSFHRLGGRVTRTFALAVASPDDKGMPAYITGRRQYNEEAFRCLDLVIARCHEYDVRLIIPFIASQSFGFVRGVDEFSTLSGKEKGSFWYDQEVKADFRHYLEFVLNRRNTVNGILYKEDPAILAWQFGNEFPSYYGDRKLDPKVWIPRITNWQIEMAAFIKTIDSKHLLMEAGGDRSALLACPDIDVMSTHIYEYWNRLFGGPTNLTEVARGEWASCRGRKPLIVDEFGLATIENNRALIAYIRETGISGGLLWSLRCHRRDGGFMLHNEEGTPINSYHYPGFGAGHGNQETQLLDLLRESAFAIRGLPVPPLTPPTQAPILFRTHGGFTWRGSTGAGYYAIERADHPEGPWELRATGLQDSVVTVPDQVLILEGKKGPKAGPAGDPAPVALWFDESAAPGSTHYYRIRGFNTAGATDYSPVFKFTQP
jgi:hypothetical protein